MMGNSKSKKNGYISPPLQKPKEITVSSQNEETTLLSLEELNAACDDFELRHPRADESFRQQSTLRRKIRCNTIIKKLKNKMALGESRCKWRVRLPYILDCDLEEIKSLIKEKLSNTCYVLSFVDKGTMWKTGVNVNIPTTNFNFKIDQPPSYRDV